MAKQRILPLSEMATQDPINVWEEYHDDDPKKCEAKRNALGIKDLTVQGFSDLLDVSKMVSRMSPQQLKDLAAKSLNAKYGVQNNDSLRDVLVKSQGLKTDFMELPALVRAQFKNDEFAYYDFLEKNSDNPYAIPELLVKITDSDFYKMQLDQLKAKDEAQKTQILEQNQSLAQQIANALKPEEPK